MTPGRVGRVRRNQPVGGPYGRLAALIVCVAGSAWALAPPIAAQEDAFSLEGLVVTASPTPRPVDAVASHVTVLSGDRLRALGVRSLADALRDVPGVAVVRNGSFGAVTSIFLRGGESDYTLVLVDGVQVNQAGGGFDFAALTIDNVERIEIVRGPSSALYGSDAVAGVIHVITRTGRGAPHGTLTFQGGAFGRQDVAADFLAGTARAGYSLAVARRSTDGVLDFNNGNVSTVVSGNARLLPDDQTRVGVSVRVTAREYHYPTDGSGATVDRNAFTFTDATIAQLSVTRLLSDRFSLEALVGIHDTDGGTDDAQDGPADTLGFYSFTSLSHFRRATGELRGHLRLESAVITAGVEIEEERQRSFTESASQFGPSTGRSESQRGNQAFFLHLAGGSSRVSFNAGGRLENNERFGQIVSWQAGATWRAPGSSRTRLRASVGRAIKEPTFFENFATGFAVGNPNLDPERSFSWEAGVDQGLFSEVVTASATFFGQSFDDLIQYTSSPNAGDPNFFNVAAATARGIEVDLAARAGRFSGGLAFTWLDTEVTNAGFDQGAGAPFVEGGDLLRRPDRTLSVRGAMVGAVWDVSASLSMVGRRSDRDFSTFPATPVTLPPYSLLSLGGEWRIFGGGGGRPSLAIQLRGENLLDESYEEVLGFSAPGRGLYVGGRVGLGGRP